MKIQVLYKDKRCSVCKTQIDKVAVVEGQQKTFADLNFSKLVHVKSWGLHFEGQQSLNAAKTLQRMDCPVCMEQFDGLHNLRKHCSANHGLAYCDVCLKHRKVFAREQKAMKKDELRLHMKDEHPVCQYCNVPFYSNDELFKHMTTEHFTCHICESAGIQFKYYREYTNLEDHFRRDHLLCEHPECLAKKFTVTPSTH
jgi:hypothetical protein